MTDHAGVDRPWGPVPGPADRVGFFEEQRAHRRATWRLSALCLLAVVAMGIAVSVVATPLLLLFARLLLLLTGVLFEVPAWPAGVLERIDSLVDPLFSDHASSRERLVGLAVLAAPGGVAMLLVWIPLRSLFLRAGAGGVLLGLGAREPKRDDLEEQQLVNVVTEMAIAAGVSPPRVMLVEAPVANAAVVGSSTDDGTLIVSRRLLDELDRDATQGVLGHLVGSMANGDLRIGLTLLSVLQTFGLLVTTLDAAWNRSARRNLMASVGFVARRLLRERKSDKDPEEAQRVSRLLTGSLTGEAVDEDDFRDEGMGLLERLRRVSSDLRLFLVSPLILASSLVKALATVAVLFALGPLMALMWRTRRYLADATAVQLTRNPDGLARALDHLADEGAVIPAGRWAAHLFVIGPEAAQARSQARFMKEIETPAPDGDDHGALPRMLGRLPALMEAIRRSRKEVAAADEGTFAVEHGIVISLHPPLQRRLQRLSALGANVHSSRKTATTRTGVSGL